MTVAVIDYNAGNTQSVLFALKRLGIEATLTSDHQLIRQADKVIFPGVGEAASAMKSLRERKLEQLIPDLKQPVLGICVGLQVMCAYSEERDTACMGIFPVKVRRFQAPPRQEHHFKIPHMGWNILSHTQTDLFRGGSDQQYVYFVHSYYPELSEFTIAQTDYIQPISAALHRDNFYATQFHPEKSGKLGAQILQNFIDL